MGAGSEVLEKLEGILGTRELASDFEDGRTGGGREEIGELRVVRPGSGIGGLEEGQRLGDGAGWVWRRRRRRWRGVKIGGEATESDGGGGGRRF